MRNAWDFGCKGRTHPSSANPLFDSIWSRWRLCSLSEAITKACALSSAVKFFQIVSAVLCSTGGCRCRHVAVQLVAECDQTDVAESDTRMRPCGSGSQPAAVDPRPALLHMCCFGGCAPSSSSEGALAMVFYNCSCDGVFHSWACQFFKSLCIVSAMSWAG